MGFSTSSLRGGVARLAQYKKVRFALVGIINTVVDFGIFLTLSTLAGVPTVVANVISTTCALAVSYLLNKKAVFGNTDTHNYRQVALFIVVTLAGLWILQSLIITGVVAWLRPLIGASMPAAVVLAAAKIVATFVSLIWNYLWYSKVVFKKRPV